MRKILILFLYLNSYCIAVELQDVSVENALLHKTTIRQNNEQYCEENSEQFSRFFTEYINHNSLENNPTFKNLLRVFFMPLGASSAIPYSKFCKEAAGESISLQYILAGLAFASVGTTKMWEAFHIIDYIYEHQEENVENRHKNLCKHITSHLLSFCSSLPYTYIVYKSNNNLIYPSLAFISQYSLSCFGYYKFFEKNNLYKKINGCWRLFQTTEHELLEEEEKKENERLANLFYKGASSVLTMNEADYISFKNNLEKLASSGTVEQYQELINSIIFSSAENKSSDLQNTLYKAYKSLFFSIPISNLFINMYLSSKSSDEVSDSLFFTIPYVAITTVPSFVLEVIATNTTSEDLYIECYKKQQSRQLFIKHVSPFFNIVANILSVTLAAGASTGCIALTERILEGSSLSYVAPLFITTGILSIIIFESFAIRDFINDISIVIAEYYGSKLMKERILFSKKMSRMGKKIEEMPEKVWR